MAIKNRIRLKTKMKNELMSKGLEGYPQTPFILKVRTKLFKTVDILEILKDWKTRGLVQNFYVKTSTSKKPVSVWRATTKILEERL